MNSPSEQLEAEPLSLNDEAIDLLTLDDDRFPSSLRPLHDTPLLLFVHGTLSEDDVLSVAIVGSRNPIKEVTNLDEWLGKGFAYRYVTVDSGFAEGIDTTAHQSELWYRTGGQ